MSGEEPKNAPGTKARTAWHPLFAELLAMHLPKGYRLLSEYQLTRQPQRIDIVIYEGDAEAGPYKGLPAIMDRLTEINLIEFKSPKDKVEWGDYATLGGYACQYIKREKPDDISKVSLFLVVPSLKQALSNELEAWGLEAKELQEGVHLIEHAPWRCWVLELDLIWRDTDNAPLSLVSRDFVEEPAAVLESGLLSHYLFVWFTQQLAAFRQRSFEMPLAHQKELEKKWRDSFNKFIQEMSPEECQELFEVDNLLKKLSPEERLRGLSPEERLKGLPAEERLKGLPAEELLKGLSIEEREKLRQLLSQPIDEPTKD